MAPPDPPHPDESAAEPLRVPAWAHTAGLLELGRAIPCEGAGATADRLLFCERIARYCWGYDERRLDLLAACFTEDAVWEGNVLGRIAIGPFVGRARIAAWLTEFWPHQHDQRRHMLLNTIVEAQTADTATTLSYLLLMGSDGKAAVVDSMGFYKVAYRREGAEWLISHLTAGFDKPFWPGDIEAMSNQGRKRHGVTEKA